MKLSKFMLLFVVAVIGLLALQAVWLYNTYQLHLTEIKDATNKIFIEALEKEMELRFIEMDKKIRELPKGTDTVLVRFDTSVEEDGIMSFYFFSTQMALDAQHFPFDLSCLDSIYSSLLNKENYPVQYQLIYTDSTNTVIETAGVDGTKGFKTEVIPIVNGTKIQAVIKIATPVVFKNMITVLILSVLMFIFIIVCLIYEAHIYQNQKYLAHLRENFTQALTHDLKTPLATIHSVLVQLNKGALDKAPEMKAKFTEIAIEQSINLQAMVNQILTVAYIDKKEVLLTKEEIDLEKIIQSLMDKFGVNDRKTIEFNLQYDLKDGIVYADKLYLTNVISNLIDNAIKYSGNSVRIDIECKVVNDQIHIKVKDNGFGISKIDQQKIFQKFERGAEIKRNSISGFGLGLNYVKRIIEAHGGAVALSSKEGEGSEFTITVPVVLTPIENELFQENLIID
ncbi:MAG: HAMP domain-containing histidine kinase [Dysgonamonadaceae bacterium]|jgi:two-component system phosphate regulon sensor histidine kinase PhoR|nr:HAMP domain-containing histidine kinase [Dysgonamonadaceae bacterium]